MRLKSMSATILLTLGKGWAFRPDTSKARSAISLGGWKTNSSQSRSHHSVFSQCSANQSIMLKEKGHSSGLMHLFETHLKPNGINYFTKHKKGKHPECTKHRGQNELQPGPHISMK